MDERNDILANDTLFDRVAAILDEARGNVVRAVNSNMVIAYWLIGREIVQEIQGGEARAEYGKRVLEDLSAKLTERYGQGFSLPNLKNFRQFYLAYRLRLGTSGSPTGSELPETRNSYPAGSESPRLDIAYPMDTESGVEQSAPPEAAPSPQGFSPQLSWSHYRALMRVENTAARDFYEREAIECGWSKTQLERQIHSFYYDRIIANRGEQGLLPDGRERLPGEPIQPAHVLKSPMVLEFLGLPDSLGLHESKLEQAIIDNLQTE